jgi:hypothetical protein
MVSVTVTLFAPPVRPPPGIVRRLRCSRGPDQGSIGILFESNGSSVGKTGERYEASPGIQSLNLNWLADALARARLSDR